jgi:hypothetical protein
VGYQNTKTEIKTVLTVYQIIIDYGASIHNPRLKPWGMGKCLLLAALKQKNG